MPLECASGQQLPAAERGALPFERGALSFGTQSAGERERGGGRESDRQLRDSGGPIVISKAISCSNCYVKMCIFATVL